MQINYYVCHKQTPNILIVKIAKNTALDSNHKEHLCTAIYIGLFVGKIGFENFLVS